MIVINEVVRRSNQGVTRPYICRDEIGRQLWVKGRSWSVRELAAEWVCACLARAWGLPLAGFDLVSVSPELVSFSAVPEIASLGSGIGFGSFNAVGAAELDHGDIESIDPELRADILLFDYWVRNGDRILGEKGGNPNLLWIVQESQLVIIDHNMAFETGFSTSDFMRNHVFGESLALWRPEFRELRHKKLLAIVGQLPDILSSVPEEWFRNDDILSTPLSEELQRVDGILRQVETGPDEFWGVCP